MKIGKSDYYLLFMDTKSSMGKGFFLKAFLSEKKYAPCFSIYNIIELIHYDDILKKI